MIDSQVIAFALAAAALTLVPGQDTMLVIRNVLKGGRRDGVITTFGICSGLFIHATLSVVGVSVLLTHSTIIFNLLQLAGAGYLIWLGLQSVIQAFDRSKQANPIESDSSFSIRTPDQSFREGFLSNMLNVKTAVFYLAFLPQFISSTDPVLAKSFILAGIHYVEGIIWLVTLSFLLDHIREYLLKPIVRRGLEGVCGVLLIAFGIRLFLAS